MKNKQKTGILSFHRRFLRFNPAPPPKLAVDRSISGLAVGGVVFMRAGGRLIGTIGSTMRVQASFA